MSCGNRCFASTAATVPLVVLIIYLIIPLATLPAVAGQPGTCHVLAGDVCGTACQQHICRALAGLYNATYDPEYPWINQQGWELISSESCDQLVSASPVTPVYCNWFGVVCCTDELIIRGKCSIHGTVQALEVYMNHLVGSIEDALFVESIKRLHDCGLTELCLDANELEGSLTAALLDPLTNLCTLTLGSNWLTGTIPQALGRLQKLQHIDLSNNWLNGTIPSFLGNLSQLQVVKLGSQSGSNADQSMTGLQGSVPPDVGNLRQLKQLTLELNALTGILPPNLCQDGGASVLQVLNVQANNLQGNTSSVERCHRLMQLNLAENAFTGSLPASPNWDKLVSYRASNNKFSGPFPTHLAMRARLLEHIDISMNMLTGLLPNEVVLMLSLTSFDASHNRFTGPINENIYYLPLLANLDVSGNLLVGTIHDAVRYAYSLKHVDISGNPGITGVLPPQLGLLEFLETFNSIGTSLSCGGSALPLTNATNLTCNHPMLCEALQQPVVETANQDNVCKLGNSLPCFLQYSNGMAPRGDNSNMRCKWIMRRGYEDAKAACAATDAQSLAGEAATIPKLNQLDQLWFVDPSYSQYSMCECLLGYSPHWNEDHTVLSCTPDPRQNVVLARVFGFAAIIVTVVTAGFLAWLYLVLRPRWLRERQLQAKRAKGAPKALRAGDKVPVSIAVTDVKDYSDLTRRHPEAMKQTMASHNNILRKACHAHAGYVLCQEGDSWSVAFHEAQDAVAFSLQVQQALAQKFQKRCTRSSTDRITRTTFSRTSLGAATEVAGLNGAEPSVHHTALDPPTGRSGFGPIAQMQEQNHTGLNSVNGSGDGGMVSTLKSVGNDIRAVQSTQLQPNSVPDVTTCTHKYYLRQQADSMASASCHPPHIHDESVSGLARRPSDSSSMVSNTSKGGWATRTLQRLSRTFIRRSSKATSSVSSLGCHHTSGVSISVRIGIATGMLQYGSDINDCYVKDIAEGLVSEAANGGQILIDQATFTLAKQSATLLGTVTNTGYKDQLLQQLLVARMLRKLKKATIQIVHRYFHPEGLIAWEPRNVDKIALAVHLGTFEIPCTAEDAAIYMRSTLDSSSGAADKDNAAVKAVSDVGILQRQQQFAVNKKGTTPHVSRYNIQLQLYSITGPCMRQHLQQECNPGWAQPVRMLQDWVKTEKGYFDAPGADYSNLVLSSHLRDFSHQPLPDMAIVFVSVADADVLKSELGKTQSHRLNRVIRHCMLQQLNNMPGGDGYLCHQMGSKHKFMLSFQHPHVALQWCLMVQEAMCYVDWPEHLLELPEFMKVQDPATGQRLFVGPRLRMGIAYGQLSSVQPDHTGRADYYGECVNRAARYMGAAAHGGQVVTDIQLLQKIFHQWAASADDEPHQRDGVCSAAVTTREPASLPTSMLARMVGEPFGMNVQQSAMSETCRPVPRKKAIFGMLHRSRSATDLQSPCLISAVQQHGIAKGPGPSPSSACLPETAHSFTIQPKPTAKVAVAGDRQSACMFYSQPLLFREVEQVSAWHLGTFTFKGSGDYDMAHVLPASLAGRTFPDEPPTGKGARLAVASGPVMGLPDVRMQVPKQVLESRLRHSLFGPYQICT